MARSLFQKGNKASKGGKRLGAGRKTNAELEAKAARLEIWERQLSRWDERHAKRFCEEAMKDNAVLLSARKIAVPDAKQQIDLTQTVKVVRIKSPDLNG